MTRLFILAALSLFAAACSGSSDVEPVVDLVYDSTQEDQKGADTSHDQLQNDSVEDGQSGDLVDPDSAADMTPTDMLTDHDPLEDLVPDTDQDLLPEDLDATPDTTPDTLPEAVTCYDYVMCMREAMCDPLADCPACASLALGPKATNEINSIKTCIADNCSNLPDPQFGECIGQQCNMEWFHCVGGEGTAECGEVLECTSLCQEEDGPECMEACISTASEAALELLVILFITPEENGNQTFTAIADCVGGSGSATCGETVQCLNLCGEDNAGCAIQCMAQTSQEAVNGMKDMFGCGEEPCFGPMVLCIGGSGTAGCQEALSCLQTCNGQGEDEEGQCFSQCILQTTPAAAQQIVDVMECVEEKCGGQPEGCPAAMECMALCVS